MKRLCLLALLTSGVWLLPAEDLATASGKVLRDVTLTRAGDDEVLVKHAGGEERIALWDLPPAVQTRFQFDPVTALRRQAAELNRLRAELAQARGETTQAKAALTAAAKPLKPELWTNLPPTKPAVELPALRADEVVSVFDLVNHYRADATSADRRYHRQNFVLEGVIEQLDDRAFGRNILVILESPARALPVIIRWHMPDEYDGFYTKNGGREFHAPGNRKVPGIFLRVGQKVRFKVRGNGLDDGAVSLTRAELLR